MKLEIWHNIMWPRYKAAVFSALQREVERAGDSLRVYQVAESDSDRAVLSPVDRRLHNYPYDLLFAGDYGRVARLRLFAAFARRAFTTDADVTIIAGYHRPEHWLLLFALMLRGRKRAVFCDSTAYDNKQTFWKGLAKRVFFSNVKAAFCYGERSAGYAKCYGARLVFPRCQAAALPSGYRADEVPPLRLARRSAGEARFLFVGRLSAEKRIDILLEAFCKLRANCRSSALRIVGEGPQARDLADLARSLHILDAVTFTGAKSGRDLFDEYLAATCLVLPSRSEPWGLVVNEALHYGCPVVVSDRCGCVPELLGSASCGLVFPCDDVDALASALARATSLYADPSATARRCLLTIAPYTPANAAAQIHAGARAIHALS